MADEAYDEVEFKMVNGDTFRRRVAAGQGESLFHDVSEWGWVDVDDSTRIRKAHVVSVTLRANAHEKYTPLASVGGE